MMTQRPTINDILVPFFNRYVSENSGVRRHRIVLSESQLRKALETEGERVLLPAEQAILGAEREFGHIDTFARVMHADDLIFALPLALHPTYLLPDPLDQRVQLEMYDRLTGNVIAARLIPPSGLECPLWDIRGAIDRAKWELNRARRDQEFRRRTRLKVDSPLPPAPDRCEPDNRDSQHLKRKERPE
ncbi:MAG TPA: hypothetical protein VGP24_02740 [Glaciihabitans sp.]|jgi:hypothetical protein|nr:hypothetical protein [Glaciihabitans sp.]